MSTDDLLKGVDPYCPALNDLCGRVEDQVKASGLRGKAAYAAEAEQLKPLLAEHRATCHVCREYQPAPYLAYYRQWPIFAGGALGYVAGLGGGSPKVSVGIGTGVGFVLALLISRRRCRLQREKP